MDRRDVHCVAASSRWPPPRSRHSAGEGRLLLSLCVGGNFLLLRLRCSLRPRSVLRFLLLALALPCVYFGGAGAAFFYRHQALNSDPDLSRLPRVNPPTSATRLMVFAPHCDDETLGCAGLMQQTLQADGAVRTVFLT